MYTDPDLLPQLKPEVTFGKVVATMVAIIVFFAIPAWVIDTYINPDNSTQTVQTGRVAGATTADSESDFTIPIINQDITLESQGGTLIVAGSVLIGIAIVMMMYVVVEERRVGK